MAPVKRRASLPGKKLKPRPRWRSLKVGDVVMELMRDEGPWVLIGVETTKQTWGSTSAYYKEGRMLDLLTGRTFLVDLDDVQVRSEVLRAP